MSHKQAKNERKRVKSILNGPVHMYRDDSGKLVIEPVTQAQYNRVVSKVNQSASYHSSVLGKMKAS